MSPSLWGPTLMKGWPSWTAGGASMDESVSLLVTDDAAAGIQIEAASFDG